MSPAGPDAGVAGRLAAVRERLAAAERRAGRPPGGVRLVAVTKGISSAALAAALDAGLSEFGESRAQELLAKVTELAGRTDPRGYGGAPQSPQGYGGAPQSPQGYGGAPQSPQRSPVWHFVGRIQRNKVPALAPVVSLWQSVDRAAVGEAIARRAPGARVLVEVNVAADAAKGGVRPEETPALVEELRQQGLAVEGLMTVPRYGEDPRPAFSALRQLGAGLGLAELSMGMSDDFEAAVEEGATIVRVGRAIFGSRADPAGGTTGPRSRTPSLQR